MSHRFPARYRSPLPSLPTGQRHARRVSPPQDAPCPPSAPLSPPARCRSPAAFAARSGAAPRCGLVTRRATQPARRRAKPSASARSAPSPPPPEVRPRLLRWRREALRRVWPPCEAPGGHPRRPPCSQSACARWPERRRAPGHTRYFMRLVSSHRSGRWSHRSGIRALARGVALSQREARPTGAEKARCPPAGKRLA